MAGEIWLNSIGDIVLDASGNRIVCDACPCGCPIAVEVTSVDIESCLGCKTDYIPIASNIKLLDNDAIINGTYTIALNPFLGPQPTGSCTYVSSLATGSAKVDYEHSTASTVTCIPPFTAKQTNMEIGVGYDSDNDIVKNVYILTSFGTFFSYDRAADGGTYGLGDSIPNTFTTCGQVSGTQGGTIGTIGEIIINLP
jgi:hypothetical protein